MKKYTFEDFNTDMDADWFFIGDSGGSRRLEISILNPLIPAECRTKIDKLLNDFILKHDMRKPLEDIAAVSGMVSAYINQNVEADKKYSISLLIWVRKEGKTEKDYIIETPILPADKCFFKFKECVTTKLESIIFGGSI